MLEENRMNSLFRKILYYGKQVKSNSFRQKVLNVPVLVLLIMMCLFFGPFFFGSAQGKSIFPGYSHDGDTVSSNQPKIDIHVNKKYDEKGNIVGYDSTYSYSSKDSSGSGMSSFHSFSFQQSEVMDDKEFKKFFSDSMMMPGDPFKDDFFRNFDFPSSSMQEMRHYMDSVAHQLSRPPEKPAQPEQPAQPSQPKKPASPSKQKQKTKQKPVLRNYNIY